jgi:hypothetical protein
MSTSSSCATNKSTSNDGHLQIRSRISTYALKTNTWLSRRWSATTGLNRTDITRAIPPRTIKVISARGETTAYSILATEAIVGIVSSRCEAETCGIAAAVCEATACLGLALAGSGDSVLADSGRADIAAGSAVL